MIKALYTGSTGMKAQERQLHTISNNLSNVNTVGFKKTRNNFQDLLYSNEKLPGSSTSATTSMPNGLQQGYGVKQVSTDKIFTQGNLHFTSNELDVSIDGDGFFQVELPDGRTAYTRNGSWKRDEAGRVVTADGYPMVPNVVLPPEAIKVNVGGEGAVEVFFENQIEPVPVGNIELASFINPTGLRVTGKNLYVESLASGPPNVAPPGRNGMGQLNQGFLELANVSLVEEMVDMIAAQRAYEANSKSITTSDNFLETSVNLVR